MSPYEAFLKQLVDLQLIERYEMTGEDTANVKIKHPVSRLPSVIQWSPLPEDIAERLGGHVSTVHGRPPIITHLECSECHGSGHTTEYGVYQLCPKCGGNGLGDRMPERYCDCQFPEGHTTNARCYHCNGLIRP